MNAVVSSYKAPTPKASCLSYSFLSYCFYFAVLAVLYSFCADLRSKRQLLAVMRSMPADESLKQDGCYT